MSNSNSMKKELLEIVKRDAWLKLKEPIRLSSGKMSDRYFDGRRVTLQPKGAMLFARVILDNIDLKAIQAVGGPSLGADPIATAVSIFAFLDKKIEIPAFLIRKEPKSYGLQKQIEGVDLKPGMNVLIVEDVITTGKSVLQAIEVVEKLGAKVAQVICLVDREEGGAEALKRYRFTPIFKRNEVEF